MVKIIKNIKGISLIELLVAIAIISMVVAPFMGSFLEATKNNNFSEDKMKTSMLAQKSMEELKSNPSLLKANVNLLNFTTYYSSGTTKIKYKVTQELLGVNEDNSLNIDKVADVPFDIIFEIDGDSLKVNSHSFTFSANPDLHNCTLAIVNNAGIVAYSIKDGQNNSIDSGNIVNVGSVTAKIQFKNNASKNFTLNVDADKMDGTDENNLGTGIVQLYIVDDVNSKFNLINMGFKKLNVYKQVSTAYKSYSNVIYKIEVVAEKDGSDINRLFSYVNKVEGE